MPLHPMITTRSATIKPTNEEQNRILIVCMNYYCSDESVGAFFLLQIELAQLKGI
jgi:hypothetical protein